MFLPSYREKTPVGGDKSRSPERIPVLQLLFHNGTVQAYTLSFEDGKTFLEGRRWRRTCNPNDQVVEARPQCW